MQNRANYEIVESECSPELVVIRDIGPWDQFWTITNATESVIEELYAQGKLEDGQMLLYYDSEGSLDELLHENGRFVGFKAGPR